MCFCHIRDGRPKSLNTLDADKTMRPAIPKTADWKEAVWSKLISLSQVISRMRISLFCFDIESGM